VRAMRKNAASVRASAAALTRSTISSADTSSLPGRWPQRLAPTWSSMCIAAAPARISERVVRAEAAASRNGQPATNFLVLRDGGVYFEGGPATVLESRDEYLKRFLV